MGNPKFCKVVIFYHNGCDNVKWWLFKSCENTSFVKRGCLKYGVQHEFESVGDGEKSENMV
jgi:hypothetical protein